MQQSLGDFPAACPASSHSFPRHLQIPSERIVVFRIRSAAIMNGILGHSSDHPTYRSRRQSHFASKVQVQQRFTDFSALRLPTANMSKKAKKIYRKQTRKIRQACLNKLSSRDSIVPDRKQNSTKTYNHQFNSQHIPLTPSWRL